jgi:hypothetical protein
LVFENLYVDMPVTAVFSAPGLHEYE